jgi:hypothetical protein
VHVQLIFQEIDAASRLFLRPFWSSGQELPVEYQVEALFVNVSVNTAKKGCRQGPGSWNIGESLIKATISQRQYRYQNHMKIKC